MRRCPIHEIARKAAQAGIPFLIIGGYAVLSHGHTRTTDDLDLITPNSRRQEWTKLLTELGMSIKHDATAFLQFDPRETNEMEVDLMFVAKEVFDKLFHAAVETKVEGIPVRTVALVHLIALKCHSFLNGRPDRRFKDIDDLIQLILVNRLDLNEPELRSIILKHGNAEIYERLRRACAD
jgi:predicted nucleotidyltransferase